MLFVFVRVRLSQQCIHSFNFLSFVSSLGPGEHTNTTHIQLENHIRTQITERDIKRERERERKRERYVVLLQLLFCFFCCVFLRANEDDDERRRTTTTTSSAADDDEADAQQNGKDTSLKNLRDEDD